MEERSVKDQLKGWKYEVQATKPKEDAEADPEGEAPAQAKPKLVVVEMRYMSSRQKDYYKDGPFQITTNAWADLATGHPTNDACDAAFEECLHYVRRFGNQEGVEYVAKNFRKASHYADLRDLLHEILVHEGHLQRLETDDDESLPKTAGEVETASPEATERLGESSGATGQPPTITPISPAVDGSSTTAGASPEANSPAETPAAL